jgi:hypothetical protein
MQTSSTDQLDVVIGFNSGDVMWFDAVNHRYNRMNKGVRSFGISFQTAELKYIEHYEMTFFSAVGGPGQ